SSSGDSRTISSLAPKSWTWAIPGMFSISERADCSKRRSNSAAGSSELMVTTMAGISAEPPDSVVVVVPSGSWSSRGFNKVSVWEAARNTSEPYSIYNVTMEKLELEVDDVDVTLSTAVNCRSMGSATWSAICSEEAPGLVAVTAIVGNSTGGISSRRSMLSETSPKTMMTMVTKAMKARFFMLSLTSQSNVVLL